MATILHIETSTEVCSVAVSQDGLCVFEREDREGPNHAVKSGVFIDEALSHIDSQLLTLDAVAVSGGPGSYTGLRIGVSTAKGVCFGRDAQLISVPTLEVLCVPVLLQEKVKEDDALLCPMLDARRMEVYAAGVSRRAPRLFFRKWRGEMRGGHQPSECAIHRGRRAAGAVDVPIGRTSLFRPEIRGCGLFRAVLSERFCGKGREGFIEH